MVILDVRLAIISDIHEDYPHLKRVISRAESLGYDLMACLGDIAGFSIPHYRYEKSRNASACLDLIRQKCQVILPGNHDLHVAGRIPGHSEGFDYPENWYKLSQGERDRIGGEKLWLYQGELTPNFSSGDLDFIRSLPEYQVLDAESFKLLLSHYAYPNLCGMQQGFYTWEGEFRAHFSFMEKYACMLGIIGHGHTRGAYIVRPGSFRHYTFRKKLMALLPAVIGVPPVTRHRKRTGFCIFDTRHNTLRIHH